MATGVQQAWSVSANANGASDTAINWSQGQLAPTVNDSARATMAGVKAAWNQLAGGATYGGTGNAYTITSDTPGAITVYGAGMIFMLKANATNTGAATVNIDGVGPVAIKTSGGADVIAGDIVSGGLYLLAYNSTGSVFTIIGSLAGASFQPLDATLTGIAALVGSAGQILRWTGTDTFTLDNTSATGRTLWNIADQAAGRTALGFATISDYVTLTGSQTLTNKTITNPSGITAANVGLGNVENKSSATIRSEISSGNVTGALGYTPYNSSNPSGYITGINSGMVTTALGYTPYSSGGGSISGSVSVTGNITASGNISAYSDRRLKKDIKPLVGALDRICRMQGVSFTMKQTGERAIGFIAQDMESVQPLLVTTDKDEIKSVMYANLTADIVEAIKELRAEILRMGDR